MTVLRLGLIGCGGMGSRHAEGFDQLEDRVRVTSAVDIEPERAEAVADQCSTPAAPLTDGSGSLQGLRLVWRLYEAEEQGVVADLRGLGLDEYRT